VTMRREPASRTARPRPGSSAAVLGVGTATLVACGSTGKGLIPAAQAGPLQSDFETVAQAAQSAEGNCTTTKAALTKTEQDFAVLPSSIDSGLRDTLQQGITNLRERALVLCAQPLASTKTTSTQTKTTPSTTATTTTPTTTTTTTTTPPTTTTTPPSEPGPGGGTPAPGVGEAEPGQGSRQGGTGAGENGGGGGGGGGSGGGSGGEAGK